MIRGKRGARSLDALERALGHKFERRDLLAEALTHASAASAIDRHNQRLEFLGDRVLGLVIAEALLAAFPGEQEGGLAPRLNALVRKETCAEVAEEIGLGAHLQMSRSEMATGGRKKTALLADAMEAVIAAVYLDGGFDVARTVVSRFWAPRLDTHGAAPIDAKTALQEWAQGRGLPLPVYELAHRDGPDHAPEFTVNAKLSTGAQATGVGASKRGAEQEAAAALLAQMSAESNA